MKFLRRYSRVLRCVLEESKPETVDRLLPFRADLCRFGHESQRSATMLAGLARLVG